MSVAAAVGRHGQVDSFSSGQALYTQQQFCVISPTHLAAKSAVAEKAD
jgi:hypothetical protein